MLRTQRSQRSIPNVHYARTLLFLEHTVSAAVLLEIVVVPS